MLKQGNAGACPPPKHLLPRPVLKFQVQCLEHQGYASPLVESENSTPPLPHRLSTAPPPNSRTGRATRQKTAAQHRGGEVPYLCSPPAHPSPGRVLAPAARALAARPPPPGDFAGMQAAAALASISSFPIRGRNHPRELATCPHQLPPLPWNSSLPCSPSLQPRKRMNPSAGGVTEDKNLRQVW